ncbi:hypothetical protein [Methylobacterium nodulans]|nr:hypothetical protein [Methylobacterium nodulans]
MCTTIGGCRIAGPLGAARIRVVTRNGALSRDACARAGRVLSRVEPLHGQEIPAALGRCLPADGARMRRPQLRAGLAAADIQVREGIVLDRDLRLSVPERAITPPVFLETDSSRAGLAS